MRSCVLDTNVVVSGLLSPLNPPGRLLDLVLAGDLELTISDAVVAEYRDVLSRSHFAFEATVVDAFLGIMQFQNHVAPKIWMHPIPPDRDDQIYLEAADLCPSRMLVTGNLRHFPKRCRGPVRVLSASEALGTLLEA